MTHIAIDFSVTLYDFINEKDIIELVVEMVDGQQKVTGERKVTARHIALRALMSTLKGEEDMPGDQKADNYALAMKIIAGGMIELSREEARRIRDRVRKGFGTMIIGQIDALLKKIEA